MGPARGEVIVEDDLIEGLNSGKSESPKIFCAGHLADVLA
jgi:phosphoglycerate dehydrogenase-like enzyme